MIAKWRGQSNTEETLQGEDNEEDIVFSQELVFNEVNLGDHYDDFPIRNRMHSSMKAPEVCSKCRWTSKRRQHTNQTVSALRLCPNSLLRKGPATTRTGYGLVRLGLYPKSCSTSSSWQEYQSTCTRYKNNSDTNQNLGILQQNTRKE